MSRRSQSAALDQGSGMQRQASDMLLEPNDSLASPLSGLHHTLLRSHDGSPARGSMNGPLSAEQVLDMVRQKWHRERHLLLVWFCVSIVTLIQSFGWLETGSLAALFGILGGWWSTLKPVWLSGGIIRSVRVTRMCALVSAFCALSATAALLYILLRANCSAHRPKQFCRLFYCMLGTATAWYALYMGLAVVVVLRASAACMLLDSIPVAIVLAPAPARSRDALSPATSESRLA